MENELIEVQEVQTPIADDTLISLAEQAEKRINAMNKIKQVSLKLTNRYDWNDQGGKPYLQVSGAEKIARMFGISWRISEPIKELLEGGHFTFTYKGYFTLAGATIEAIGTRSSKDGFFKKYGYENGVKAELPASEIDAGDVKKAAYTNCIGNGITRILGIRNLTYEELSEYAAITKDMINKIDYKKSGKTDKPIENEGAMKVSGIVDEIRKLTGTNEKTKKPWTKFVIKLGDAEYSTFSESNAKVAKEAKEAGVKVEISYKTDKYGNEIDYIIITENPPKEGESA